jgi:micrococcal nuclease
VRKLARFRRQASRFTPGHRTRSRGARGRAPWPPLAALLGVAGVLWLAADVYPEVLAPEGAIALRPTPGEVRLKVLRGSDGAAGAVLRPEPAATDGAFTLCALARQPNCVVDGDTIWYGGVKIRLEDIDTPETFEPRCAAEAALGRRATERLLELMNAGPFEVASGGRDEDIYWRKLRTILRDGRSLGEMLVAEGLARRWDGARHGWCG